MFASSKSIARTCTSVSQLARVPRANHLSRAQILKAIPVRAMASSAGAKNEWLFIIPDKPGTLQTRLDIRSKHLEGIKPHVDSGFILLGGGWLEGPVQEGQSPKFNGSILLAVSPTAEEAMNFLKNDIYTTSGVWDWDKVQVYPFKTAVGRGV